MRLLRSNTLAAHIISVVLLASSIAVGTLVLALVLFDQVSSTALLQSRLTTLADVVGQNSTAALNFEDTKAAVEVLEALRFFRHLHFRDRASLAQSDDAGNVQGSGTHPALVTPAVHLRRQLHARIAAPYV